VYLALDQQGINFLLLTHNPAEHQKYPRMFFYNFWYQWSFKKTNKPVLSENRQWTWSCLNANTRPHRVYNFLFSRQQEYFSQAYFSIFNSDGSTRSDDIELDFELKQQWATIKNDLPLLDRDNIVPTDIDLPALTDAYIHLVTETTVIPKIFVTEKTWKPIASKQLFLIFGNPGTVEFLRSLGVDVFDDIINHDYDQESDWRSRLIKLHQEIKRLVDPGVLSHWQATQQRRQLNYDKFWSGQFDCNYSKDIKLAIDQCLK
jgi:hypothetical protein